MNVSRTFVAGVLGLGLGVAAMTAAAQSSRAEAGMKELNRKAPVGTQACSLVTRADVTQATGQDPYQDPEPYGQGGWICNVGTAELKVYAGPKSTQAWESTLKSFKADKEPRMPAPAFGPGAYFILVHGEKRGAPNVAVLVAKKGEQLLVLSVDARSGKPAESAKPAVEALMKKVLSRL